LRLWLYPLTLRCRRDCKRPAAGRQARLYGETYGSVVKQAEAIMTAAKESGKKLMVAI